MFGCDLFNSKCSLMKLISFILIFSIFFDFGWCGLKLLKQLAHYQNFFTTSYVNEPPLPLPPTTTRKIENFVFHQQPSFDNNPCPNIFEYRYDELGRLYGFLEIPVTPNIKTIDLEVVFCIGNQVEKGGEGSISLPYQNNQQIINDIIRGSPLNYKINFPAWQRFQPKITKISANHKTLCTGNPYSIDSVPILTTINLRHKLKINLDSINQNFYQVDDGITSSDNPIFNIRNDRQFPTNNPYNFNPKPTEPETSLDHYSKNPFFYNFTKNDESFTGKFRPNRNPEVDGTSQFYNNICGRPIITNSLVFYGKSVPQGAFPWLVAMFIKTGNGGLEYHCTATLISKNHVLTAAHCIKLDNSLVNPEKIVFVMGRLNIQGWGTNENEKIVGADQIFLHPDFKPSTADADIALISLKSEIVFSNFIRPICLWKDDSDLNLIVGKNGIVVGWGKDENGLKISSEAKQIQLPIVSQEQCLRSNYTYAEITSERTFCAGDRNGSGPCNGDSGSGFIILKNGRWTLRGIVSMSLSDPYTRTCDLTNYVVFTDVSKFTDWLLNLVQV